MLRNTVTIEGKEYSIKEGSYIKRKVNSTVPRFANDKISLSDLSAWSWWSQSLWHGGFDREFIDTDPPIGFNKSENLDMLSKVGKIKRAKSVLSSASISGLRSPVFAPYTASSRYVYFGGNFSVGKLRLYRKAEAAAPSQIWQDVSGGQILAMSEFMKDGGSTPRLYLGISPSFGTNYLKYTTGTSVLNDTNWSAASGIPYSLKNAEYLLWLINNNGLYTYDQTTPTRKVLDPDVNISSGTRGQLMEYDSGGIYWIGYGNSTGRLYVYDIVADTDTQIYQWPGNFEPKFIKKFSRGGLIIGGVDRSTDSAALYEFNTTTNELKTIKVWESSDDEQSAEAGTESGDLFYISIAPRGTTNALIYQYDGNNLALYLKKDVGTIGASIPFLFANKFHLILNSTGDSGLKYGANTTDYQISGSIESSKIDADLFGVQKYWGGVTVVHNYLPASSYIKLKTRVDTTTHWSALPVRASNGLSGTTSFEAQLVSANIGKKFEYYLKISGATAKDVEIEDVAVRYLIQPENKLEWYFDLLLIDNLKGINRNSETMKQELLTALRKVIVNFKDIDGVTYDESTPIHQHTRNYDRGVIVENIEFLGPYLQGEKGNEYIARVHLIEG